MRAALRALPLLAALALTTPLAAQRAHIDSDPGPAPLPFLDARLDGDLVLPSVRDVINVTRTEAGRVARDAAFTELSSRIPDLRMDEDEFFGTPHFLRSTRQLLTEPSIAAFTPTSVVRDFIDANQPLFEINPGEINAARVARDFQTRHNGLTHLTYQQQVNGLDVFGAEIKANVTGLGELVNISSTMVPRPDPDFDVPGAQINSSDAIFLAAANVGITLTAEPRTAGPSQGLSSLQTWAQSPDFRADTPVTTELVLFPMDRLNLHPAWVVVLPEHGVGNTYEIMVDAIDGSVLRRDNRLKYLVGGSESASYNVFTGDSPAPGSPGLSTPGTTQFPLTTRTLVTSGATSGSPEGWIPDGVNETNGNNCDAHLDLNNDNAPDLPRPAGSPYRVFDYPIDFAQSPTTYQDAAVTQLFYYMNHIHDVLYGYGFDEPASNFQVDNFGLGGVGGDPVSADAQDGGSTNNANWNGSGSDGGFTWIQMYVFDGPTPDRDGDFDGDVVYHEYVHGLSIRLSGGTVSGEQSGGMGEGWGDFFGVCMSAEASDDPEAEYAMGGYITKDFLGTTENYYYGIRRYPYSHDLGKSPLTYADLDPAQLVIPGGIPNNGLFSGNPADEVHNVGEIWTNALLECRSELWNGGMGFAANDLIMQLVVDGLKLMPSNPNMLEARDAIIAADLAGFGGAHLSELWSGFAYRGMGDSASSPSGSTTTGIVEAFDTPALIVFDFASGQPDQLSPGMTTAFPVDVTALSSDTPLPGTGMLHTSINGGPFSATAMTPTGMDTYSAALPALNCFDTLDYYVSVDSTAGVQTSPNTAPTDFYSATVFTSTTVLFADDFEAASGWSVGGPFDDATTGVWVLDDPLGTSAQSGDDHTPSGTECFFTGQGTGGSVGENDVDGGQTTLTSPVIDLSSGDALIRYWRWYNNVAGGAPNADIFEVEISNNGGSSWLDVETVGPTGPETGGGWFFHEFTVSDILAPTSTIQVRFIASDESTGSIVEAMVDDFDVVRLECSAGTVCQTDIGFGGPGTMALTLCGQTLASGNLSTMEVTGAPSNGLVFLIGGLSNNPTPFEGGTLVPLPILVTLVRVADPSGFVSVSVPGGGGPVTVYIQAAAVDAALPGGYAISNALEALVLP